MGAYALMRVKWVLPVIGMRIVISLSMIPFGRVSCLGMRTARMAKPAPASLGSSAALPLQKKVQSAPTSARSPVAMRRVSLSAAMSVLYVEG